MAKPRRMPTLFEQLTALAIKLAQTVKSQQTSRDDHNGMTYKHTMEGEDMFLRQAIVIIDQDLLTQLSARGLKLLVRIMTEMAVNNVFWRHNHPSAHERGALAELKRREILMPTEQVGLFIVNPFKVRRGKPLASIMASLSHYHEKKLITSISDLKPPKKALISSGR